MGDGVWAMPFRPALPPFGPSLLHVSGKAGCRYRKGVRDMSELGVSSIADTELLRRAVSSARPRKWRSAQPRWTAVMDAFCLGSTYARELCRRFDLDPDEMVRRA
jgi:hypothetical protein